MFAGGGGGGGVKHSKVFPYRLAIQPRVRQFMRWPIGTSCNTPVQSCFGFSSLASSNGVDAPRKLKGLAVH